VILFEHFSNVQIFLQLFVFNGVQKGLCHLDFKCFDGYRIFILNNQIYNYTFSYDLPL